MKKPSTCGGEQKICPYIVCVIVMMCLFIFAPTLCAERISNGNMILAQMDSRLRAAAETLVELKSGKSLTGEMLEKSKRVLEIKQSPDGERKEEDASLGRRLAIFRQDIIFQLARRRDRSADDIIVQYCYGGVADGKGLEGSVEEIERCIRALYPEDSNKKGMKLTIDRREVKGIVHVDWRYVGNSDDGSPRYDSWGGTTVFERRKYDSVKLLIPLSTESLWFE